MSACRKARTAGSALVFVAFALFALFALFAPAFSLAVAATPHPWPSPHTPSHAPEMSEPWDYPCTAGGAHGGSERPRRAGRLHLEGLPLGDDERVPARSSNRPCAAAATAAVVRSPFIEAPPAS